MIRITQKNQTRVHEQGLKSKKQVIDEIVFVVKPIEKQLEILEKQLEFLKDLILQIKQLND